MMNVFNFSPNMSILPKKASVGILILAFNSTSVISDDGGCLGA